MTSSYLACNDYSHTFVLATFISFGPLLLVFYFNLFSLAQIMSRSTFTSPVSTNTHNKPVSNLFGLLEKRLNQHNDKVNNQQQLDQNHEQDANLQHFASQFEKLQKKRRMSYGDKAPTPSNSPAIHQSGQNPANYGQNSSTYRAYGQKPIKRGLISPLHLSLSRKMKPFTSTPPVTPEFHNNQQNANQKVESVAISSSLVNI